MSFNISTPFSLPIYTSSINSRDFSIIKDETLTFIDNNKNIFKESWNCPTLSTISTPYEFNFQNLLLNHFIKSSVENYYKEWGFLTNNDIKLNLDSLWINISKPGSFQETHKHTAHLKTVLFSGVFYIEVKEDSGDLVLTNPLESLLINMLPSSTNLPFYNITPQNNLLILFPSWLDHRVDMNKSNTDRISISFNIDAIRKS